MSSSNQRACRTRQRGFALVSGIFLITILFLLSAYMVSLQVRQDASATLDTLGTRAYAAARSGAEWGAYQSLRTGACAADTAITPGGMLAGFTVNVSCTRTVFNEAGTAVTTDTIVANACNQPAGGTCPNAAPGTNYVERQITLAVGL
ncbi:MAG: agglutinin biogenesis protein MshP [Pseudomonadota bacterium]